MNIFLSEKFLTEINKLWIWTKIQLLEKLYVFNSCSIHSQKLRFEKKTSCRIIWRFLSCIQNLTNNNNRFLIYW